MGIIQKFVVYEEGRLPGVLSLRRLMGRVVTMASVREYIVFSMIVVGGVRMENVQQFSKRVKEKE